MAIRGNRHCVSCIGTLSFPIARFRRTGQLLTADARYLKLGLPRLHFPNPGRGSGGITPGKFWNSICDLVHFEAIWW